MKYPFITHAIKLIVVIIILGFTQYAIAQELSPTPQSLKKAIEYWKTTLLKDNTIKNNKDVKKNIDTLAKKRIDESEDIENIRTIDEYVAIFTLDWESTKLNDGKKFRRNYKDLYKQKNTIQALINKEEIKKMLLSGIDTTQQKNSKNEQENKNEEENKQDSIKKANEAKEKGNNNDTSNIFVYVVLGLSVILPLLLWLWSRKDIKKEVKKQVEKEIKNKQATLKNTQNETREVPENEIRKVKAEIEQNIKQMISNETNKIKVDLEALVKNNQNTSTAHTPEIYYFGRKAVKGSKIVDDQKREQSNENTCFVITTEDNKQGTINVFKDNIDLILTYQSEILTEDLAEKIGWDVINNNNKLNRIEPGEVTREGEYWIVTKKITIYFNQ